ncbi:MAG: ABC transporter substrate-binding protein [Candidatus Rokuibacteriota bacterium]
MERKTIAQLRSVLVGLVVAMVVSGAAPAAHAQREPIRIGLLNALTGPLAVNGTEINEGIRLYWEDEMGGQVAGRPVRLIVEDTEAKPDVGLTKARKLAEADRVHLILGPVSSGVALAIRDYLTERKVPLIITQATANQLTAEKASPVLFRSAMSSYQQEAAGGWYVAAKLGHKRIAVVALDYVAGHEQADGFIKTFMESGGQSVEKVLMPLGATDVAPYLTRIQSKAGQLDAVVAILWGPSAPQWLRAYQDYGLKGKLPLLALGETVSETYLQKVGDAALGIVSWFSYTPTLDTPENKRFVQAFTRKYRKEPVYNNHLGYLAARAGGEALKAVNANVEDQARFLAALRKVRFEAPGGSFAFDDKQNAVIPTYIRRVEKVGGKLQNTVVDTVRDVDQFWKPPR